MKTFQRTNRDDAIKYIGEELITKVEAAEIKITDTKPPYPDTVEVSSSIRHGAFRLTMRAILSTEMADSDLSKMDWSNIGLLNYTFEVANE